MVDTFTERVNVYFDDVRVDVLVKYLPTDPSLPNDPDNSLLGTMRLRGRMPEASAHSVGHMDMLSIPIPC